MEDKTVTVSFKKAIARKALIVGGVVVGIIIAGALLNKVKDSDLVVVEETAE